MDCTYLTDCRASDRCNHWILDAGAAIYLAKNSWEGGISEVRALRGLNKTLVDWPPTLFRVLIIIIQYMKSIITQSVMLSVVLNKTRTAAKVPCHCPIVRLLVFQRQTFAGHDWDHSWKERVGWWTYIWCIHSVILSLLSYFGHAVCSPLSSQNVSLCLTVWRRTYN